MHLALGLMVLFHSSANPYTRTIPSNDPREGKGHWSAVNKYWGGTGVFKSQIGSRDYLNKVKKYYDFKWVVQNSISPKSIVCQCYRHHFRPRQLPFYCIFKWQWHGQEGKEWRILTEAGCPAGILAPVRIDSIRKSPDIKVVSCWVTLMITEVTEMDLYWFQTRYCCLGKFLRASWGLLWETRYKGGGADGSRGQHNKKFPARSSRLLEDWVLSLLTPSQYFLGKKKSKPPWGPSVLESKYGVSVSVITHSPESPCTPRWKNWIWGKKINLEDDFRTYQRMNLLWAQRNELHMPFKTWVYLCQNFQDSEVRISGQVICLYLMEKWKLPSIL